MLADSLGLAHTNKWKITTFWFINLQFLQKLSRQKPFWDEAISFNHVITWFELQTAKPTVRSCRLASQLQIVSGYHRHVCCHHLKGCCQDHGLPFRQRPWGKKPTYIKECNSAVQLCNLASNGRSEKLTWSVLYCVQCLLYCSIQCVVQCPVLRMSDKRRGFLVQSCLPQEAWAASKIELHGWLRFQHQGDSRWMEWRRLEMRHPKVSTLSQL